MSENELTTLMTDLGALRRGHFLLSSGRHSDTYFQCAMVLQFPELAAELGRRIAAMFDARMIDVVVSPALGALLLGHEVARALGRRFIFTERQDGEMTLRRGFQLEKRENVLIVEDVVTRGTSTREVAGVVAEHEALVGGVGALVDRTTPDVEMPADLQALLKVDAVSWDPAECPLCKDGTPAVKPGSRDRR